MDLEGNLSKLVVKKSIPVPLRGRRDQNQSNNQEAMQEQHFHRLQIKRIKTQDPLSLYRIRDVTIDNLRKLNIDIAFFPSYLGLRIANLNRRGHIPILYGEHLQSDNQSQY